MYVTVYWFLCPAALLNSLISSINILIASLEFAMYSMYSMYRFLEDGELYNQQKQDWELTVAQIMNSLLKNSDINWRK